MYCENELKSNADPLKGSHKVVKSVTAFTAKSILKAYQWQLCWSTSWLSYFTTEQVCSTNSRKGFLCSEFWHINCGWITESREFNSLGMLSNRYACKECFIILGKCIYILVKMRRSIRLLQFYYSGIKTVILWFLYWFSSNLMLVK